MSELRWRSVLVASVVLVAACTYTNQRQLYHWGSYESLLYSMYVEPEKALPAEQIEKLTQDISRAQAQGRKVAPGIYAHLGMMYAATGDVSNAENAFSMEKMLYPESAVLIDGMLARASKNKK